MKIFLKFICKLLEILCCLTHPFAEIEIKLTGQSCNLAILSLKLNDKYDLGVWTSYTAENDEKCGNCRYATALFEGAGCGDWIHEFYCYRHGKIVNRHYVCTEFELNGKVA